MSEVNFTNFCGFVTIELKTETISLEVSAAKELSHAMLWAKTFHQHTFSYVGNIKNFKSAGLFRYYEGARHAAKSLTYDELKLAGRQLRNVIDEAQAFLDAKDDGSKLHAYTTMNGIDVHNELDLTLAIGSAA